MQTHSLGFRPFLWSLAIAMLFLNSNPAIAQDDVELLVKKIQTLEQKVAQLEAKIAMTEHVAPSKSNASYEISNGEGLLKSVEDIHVGGYVSTSYNYDSNSPLPDASSGAGPTAGAANASGNNTNLRAFDRDANSFGHYSKLVIEKPAETGGGGFRTDLMFGRDAQILNSITVGDATGNVFTEQAYVQYISPIGNGVDIKAGRFVTIVGSEVAESKDNWNTSRSLLLNNAQPATHNGILASYKVNDLLDLKLGVANGWDSGIDNNKSKTLLSSFAIHPMQGFDITNSLLLGPEQARTTGGANTDKNLRGLWDVVVAWTPIKDFEKWKWLLNFDYGWEENSPGKLSEGNAIWHGLAAGSKYDLTNWLTFAGRWEYFADPDGVRTSGLNGLTPVQDTVLFEMTYTLDFKIAKNLITRLEYRFDQAQDQIFDLSNNIAGGDGARQNQQTFGTEMIYMF